METKTFSVPAMHCAHCKAAVRRELEAVAEVVKVDVDLDKKLVTVGGENLDAGTLIDAIDEAGYDAQPVAP